MLNEQLIGKDKEGSGCGLSDLISRNLPVGTEESHEKSSLGQSISVPRFKPGNCRIFGLDINNFILNGSLCRSCYCEINIEDTELRVCYSNAEYEKYVQSTSGRDAFLPRHIMSKDRRNADEINF
jgi:hypothetical protein